MINALENDAEPVRWYIVQAFTNITGQSFGHNLVEWKEWFQKNQEKGLENE